ncbi:MAG: hypothetical protein ABSE80_13390 [Halobacteriota archaeon]|jgi:hypothetical protein
MVNKVINGVIVKKLPYIEPRGLERFDLHQFYGYSTRKTPTMGEYEGSPSQPEDNDSYLDGK